jgi:hypothetical protein
MSLLIPSELTSPVAANVEVSSNLTSIPVVREFLDVFLIICLGYHRIEMWSSLLS